MDEVAENSDALMERYLEGEEISHEEIVTALEDGTDQRPHLPRHLRRRDRSTWAPTGCSTRSSTTCPRRSSTAAWSSTDMTLEADRGRRDVTPTCSRRAPTRSRAASTSSASTRARSAPTRTCSTRAPTPRSAWASCSCRRARRSRHTDAFGPGDIGAVAKLKETRAGDWLADRDQPISMPSIALPAPVMAFAIEPKAKGDEDKVFTALRRLQEEDPTIDLHRDDADRRADRGRAVADPRRGGRRPPEVALRRRGDAEAAARALPGDDPRHRQGARAPQEADRRPRPVRRLPHRDRAARRRRLRVRQRDQGRRDPDELHPRGREGRDRGDAAGRRRRLPGQGRPRAAVRRPLPHGRLVGDGVQDRRLDRHAPGARAGRRRCCSSRSCSSPRRCPSRASATSWATSPRAAAARSAPRPPAA